MKLLVLLLLVNTERVISAVPQIWLVGSSLIRRSFLVVKRLYPGLNMGVQAELWWQGYGGLTLEKTKAKLVTLLKIRDPPSFLLLHVGGNDLGTKPLKKLHSIFLCLIEFLKSNFPKTTIIWSEILPREWSGNKGLDAARKRLNSLAVKHIRLINGFYLRHKNLLPFNFTQYASDGVHLSEAGSYIFVENIHQGIVAFLHGEQPWFT